MQICPEGEIAGGREEGVMEKMKEQTKRQKLTFLFMYLLQKNTFDVQAKSMFQASHQFFLPTSLVTSEQKKTKMKLQTFNTFPPHSQALLHINLTQRVNAF